MTWIFFILVGGISGTLLALLIAYLPSAIERDSALPAPHVPPVDESHCSHCSRMLNSPERLVSIGLLRTAPSCFHCGERIATLLPLVISCSVVAAAIARLLFGPTFAGLAAFALSASLIAASTIDLRHRLLPDALTLPLLWAGLIVNLGGVFAPLHSAVLGSVIGYLVLWILYWAFRLVCGIDGMGYGDFKLLAAIGAWLGWEAIPWVIVISSLTGALVGGALIATRRIDRSTPIAFGPFLAIGGIAVLYSRFAFPQFL